MKKRHAAMHHRRLPSGAQARVSDEPAVRAWLTGNASTQQRDFEKRRSRHPRSALVRPCKDLAGIPRVETATSGPRSGGTDKIIGWLSQGTGAIPDPFGSASVNSASSVARFMVAT